MFEMLLAGADPDSRDIDGNTALHWAVWFRQDNLLRRLLLVCKLDARNNVGETSMHWAARCANMLALQELYQESRALLSMRDMEGITPFLILAQTDNAPMMEWMYLKGLSLEEQDDTARTALHWACYKGHRRTVQWLLSRNADITHGDKEGLTPMHWAAIKGFNEVADMLMLVGAVKMLHVVDSLGDSPMSLAQSQQNWYMALNFRKCQVFNYLFGRPIFMRNHYANVFVAFAAANVGVYAAIIAPGIVNDNPGNVIAWTSFMATTLLLWAIACCTNPGWIKEDTILAQAESQKAGADGSADFIDVEAGAGRLESEGHNFQRPNSAQKPEDGTMRGSHSQGRHGPHMAEMQPLMNMVGGLPTPLRNQPDVSLELWRRAQVGENLVRARMSSLTEQGGAEYVQLLQKGDFKQICVICRTQKEPRSHHCKDCGRCVRRMDHHCPWIDNCVGLGNQRTFYCFVLLLLATLVAFYCSALLFFADCVIPAWTSGAAFRPPSGPS